MALLTVTGWKVMMDYKYISLGISPKEEDYSWTEVAIRSEDVMECYKRGGKTIVCFYDERPPLVIKESLQDFTERLTILDYDIFIESSEADEKS